ncbi:MAG: hypothetical protein Q8L49_00350 [Burkholderiaceae bacterium]|nr:hypothetical protein [Burkholderiaceae bacterium]
MNARDKSYDESLDAALLDPVEAAAYLEAVIEMDDPAALLLALRQVARVNRPGFRGGRFTFAAALVTSDRTRGSEGNGAKKKVGHCRAVGRRPGPLGRAAGSRAAPSLDFHRLDDHRRRRVLRVRPAPKVKGGSCAGST